MAKYVKTEQGYQEIKEVNSDKMNAYNPVGSGSFSMERKPGSQIGAYSHAEGYYTTASGQYSHAEGKCNVVDSQHKYAHIVGNGTSVSARSNAHTLDWNGVPWFKGRPQFGGTAQDQGSQTVVANGDKELILKSSTANSTKKFKITVDDSGTLTATEITQ